MGSVSGAHGWLREKERRRGEIHCGYMIPGNRPQIGREMKGSGKNESKDNEEGR